MTTTQPRPARLDIDIKLPRSGKKALTTEAHSRTAEHPDNSDLYAVGDGGYTRMGQAVLSGNVEQLRFLVQEGVNLSHPVHNVHQWMTALRLAETLDRLEVVEALCQLGLDPSQQQPDGSTALHTLMGFSPRVNRVVVAAARNLEARNELGLTALQYAVSCNKETVVRALLEGGADIEARDERGCTALMYAASRQDSEIASCLLSCRADVSAHDENGKTALYYAMRFGVPDTARVLVQAGATPDEHTLNCKDYQQA